MVVKRKDAKEKNRKVRPGITLSPLPFPSCPLRYQAVWIPKRTSKTNSVDPSTVPFVLKVSFLLGLRNMGLVGGYDNVVHFVPYSFYLSQKYKLWYNYQYLQCIPRPTTSYPSQKNLFVASSCGGSLQPDHRDSFFNTHQPPLSQTPVTGWRSIVPHISKVLLPVGTQLLLILH
jgi:hypothetical protein